MASCSELIQDLQKELICSICMEFFTNPLSIECGHSFCHDCLLRSWQEVSPPFLCPECRNVIRMRHFKANIRLGKLAAIAKKHHYSPYSEGRRKCKVHQKVEKLFCEDDQRPICVPCSQSQEHEGHTLCCLHEAAEDFRQTLQTTVTDLWKKTENIARQMVSERIKFALMEKEIDIQKRSIWLEFQKMRRFLDEEINAHLSYQQAQGMANLKGLSKTISGLSRQCQELRKRITDLEEEQKKPDLDLLQNTKGVLNRNEVVLQKETEIFSICLTTQTIPGVMEWIFNLKVDITLDSNTADPGLIISEDLKSVRYRGVKEEAPQSSGRLIDFAQVFGTQSFISGRHYWEVEVPDNTLWCVGICPKSKESQEFFVLRTVKTHHSYFLYAAAEYNLYCQVHTRYRQVSVPNLKVGIFLDYECGEISFYHVKKRYLIYTFPATTFSGSLIPFFCLSKKISTGDCSLIICP
ncbi:E3 ubiquitin-protein ligase TRIM11-like [Petaurus breviceps papuanus]|uniref:E3 ubiquitin-protein ligase TRIM11-like n=1 Tax=Petaurus breviceps papuanus TaxID=3040969 RepID=UPI0036D93B7F